MASSFSNRVLIVDGEPLILRVYSSQLSRFYSLDTASTAEDAMKCLVNKGPYAVVITDIQLPDMDGVQMLSRLREDYPDTVRVLLTASGKHESVTEAINQGGVFQFLCKPCTSERLGKTIEHAIERYRRTLIEKQFLTGAVNAAIQIQLDFLELMNPAALEKSRRVESLVRYLVDHLSPPNGWMVNLAARLCMVGAAVPPENAQGQSIPEIGAKLMGRLSQLREIVDLIRWQRTMPDIGTESQGARFLQLALRYDDLVDAGSEPMVAVATISEEQIEGDGPIVDMLSQYAAVNSLSVYASPDLSGLALAAI